MKSLLLETLVLVSWLLLSIGSTSNAIASIQKQLYKENIPIFTIKNDLSNILDMVNATGQLDDKIAVDNILNQYLEMLKEHYLNRFQSKIDHIPKNSLKISETKSYFMKEFRIAVESAVPNNTDFVLAVEVQKIPYCHF
jgi:hypothetical protein